MLTTGKIIHIERLNNSVNGNPRFKVLANTVDEGEIMLVTKSDAQVGYKLDNRILSTSRSFIFWYHKTRAGNYVLDNML